MGTFKAMTIASPGVQPYCVLPFMALRKEFVMCEGQRNDGSLVDLQYHVDYDITGSILNFNMDTPDMADVETVRVYRKTPTEYLLTQYVDASVLKAYDMNVRDVQMLHILEEAYDYILWYGMLFDFETGTWNAKAGRITNMAEPENEKDATTKIYVDHADDEIKQYIQDYCLLFDEVMSAWDARSKTIAKVAEPKNATDATTKHYVDAAIQTLDQAIRAYIAEVRSALQEAINALTERVATNEQAIERLTTRMATAEENIAGIQQTLTRHAQAIAANTQGINANTEAIEAIQSTLASMQDKIDHLPSGGGGSVDIDVLKEEIYNSLMTPTARPYVSDVRHESYGGGWQQWNVVLGSYNPDAVSIAGNQWAETPGTYTLRCSLKPLYCWTDGTRDSFTLEWVAEGEVAQTGNRTHLTAEQNGDAGTIDTREAYSAAGFTFSGSASSPTDWNAPVKTIYFAADTTYTTLKVDYNGTIYSEGDTFTMNDYSGSEPQSRFTVTVNHDNIRVECNGPNTLSPEFLHVFVDDAETNNTTDNYMQIELTAEGWVEAVPKIQLSAVQVNGIEHPMTIQSPYSLSLDKTASAENWPMAANQTLKFTISEPYTTLHAKVNTTGEVIDEGNASYVTSVYQGEAVNRYQIAVEHDNVTIIGLGYNSTVSSSFTVYTDDDEANGFVVTITQTAHFPAIIGYDNTPRMGTGTPYTYSDSTSGMSYKYPRMTGYSPSNSELAEFVANGTLTKSNMILSGDFCVYEKRDSGDYTFTLTPAEGYEWPDHTRTPKEYTWTHERTLDDCAAPTLTLLSEHKKSGSTPLLFYGGNDMVIQYETESDGEISVEVPDNAQYPRHPVYEVDRENHTITLRLTEPSRFEKQLSDDEKQRRSYEMLVDYVYNNTLIRVKTLKSARYKESSQRTFYVEYAKGAYVEYDKRDNSINAAHANGTQLVYLPKSSEGCTIEEGTDKASTIGTHILRATLNDNIEAWWDGSTERTREFEWTLHKPCPISKQWTTAFVGDSPTHGYNYTSVWGISRGIALSPAPTITVIPSEMADKIEITPIGSWGDSSRQQYAVTNKCPYEYNEWIYAKVEIAEGENTAPLVYIASLVNRFKGKPAAGYMSNGIYSSYYLEDGVQENKAGLTIEHGEISSINDIQVTVEDPSIVDVALSDFRHNHADYPQETSYRVTVTVTPKVIGTTNVTVTIPETEHYRALTITQQVQIKNKS